MMSNSEEKHRRGVRRDLECDGKAGSSVWLWKGVRAGGEGVWGVQTPHWPPTATPTADECSEGNRSINARTHTHTKQTHPQRFVEKAGFGKNVRWIASWTPCLRHTNTQRRCGYIIMLRLCHSGLVQTYWNGIGLQPSQPATSLIY